MTTASKGLAGALARVTGGVKAIGEMSAEDLLAQMTVEQKTALSAAMAPAAAAADPAPSAAVETMPKKKDGCEGEASEDGDEDDKNGDSDMKAAASASQDRIKAVAAAVATDDACKGKADLALQMLADDDYAGLSASGIVKLLGKQSVEGAAAADPEAAARADMQAALADTTNANITTTTGGNSNKTAEASSVWDKAYSSLPGTKAA